MSDRPEYPTYPGDDPSRSGSGSGDHPWGSQPDQPPQGPPQAPAWGQPPTGDPYAYPSYGQAVPGAPPGHAYRPAPPTSTKALVGMILGIVSIPLCYVGVLLGPAAIVLSVMAQSEFRRRPGQQSGEGMAVAGLVTGIVGTVVQAGSIVLIIIGSTTTP